MLTTLPPLLAPPRADSAPASTARPAAALAGDHSFASMVRRQGEQRLDALRLGDQQALAARVSAAAATAMPRPRVEPLASRPPMPGQAPAPRPQAAAPPAPAKVPGPTSRPAAPRSSPADSAVANRPLRERKPGATPGANALAEDATRSAAGEPTPLPLADSGLSGLVGAGVVASVQEPGAALPTLATLATLPELPELAGLSGLVQEPAAQPAMQAAAGPGAPTSTSATSATSAAPAASAASAASAAAETAGAGPTDGAGQPGPQPLNPQVPAAAQALTSDDGGRAAPNLRPAAALATDLPPGLGDRASPATQPALAGRPTDPITAARRQGSDGLNAADGALTQGPAPMDEPVADTPDPQRQHGPTGPDALAAAPAALRDAVSAAALSGTWRPGPAPNAGENPAAPTAAPAADRRAGATLAREGAGPQLAARPSSAWPVRSSALDGQTAAAVQSRPGQPGGSATQDFNTAWQSVLAQATAQPGMASAAEHSAEAPVAGQIDAPVDGPLFGPALGSRLSLLARDGVRSALLQLHPAEMGPISVQIALDGNAARIDFQALRADTRGFIEASLPALAGALQDAGLTLAGGGVFEQAPGHQPQAQAQAQADPGPGGRQPVATDSGSAGQQDAAPPARRTAPRGLVDLVA